MKILKYFKDVYQINKTDKLSESQTLEKKKIQSEILPKFYESYKKNFLEKLAERFVSKYLMSNSS